MRIYMDATEAIEEIKRDLAEMGITVKPSTMQDKYVKGNPDYETLELQNYCYTILDAKANEVPGVSQPWADAEFKERIMEGFSNPGEAYKLREEVWNEFLHDGKFAYTYNERLNHNNQLTKIVNRLREDPDSRQLWMSLWDPSIDPNHLGGVSRVPCSLGYGLQVREGKLNLHYVMRSADFSVHFRNDVYLAMRLLEHIADLTGYEVGSFTHTMFSLHVYRKDMVNVF